MYFKGLYIYIYISVQDVADVVDITASLQFFTAIFKAFIDNTCTALQI